MIRVRFDPSALTGADAAWWKAWSERAEKAREKVLDAVANKVEPKFNEAVWGDLKVKLLELAFHGKCAYCESKVVDHTDNPAAEHYRPKRTPTVRDPQSGAVLKVQVKLQANTVEHPGYYWLAYAWRNLVPACSQCNSNGKGNSFPVRKSHVAAHDPTRDDPDALNALEEPLLLHPYDDDPSPHLAFDACGGVAARDASDRGVASIRDYRLDRTGLCEERRAAQSAAWAQLRLLALDGGTYLDVVRPYREGRAQYSAAVLAALRPKLRALIAEEEQRLADMRAALGT